MYFDWARAIERNRDALTAILASLFAMLGLQASATVGRIPRSLHRAVLRLLRPAESATRRLIIIAARGLVVKPVASRPSPKGRVITRASGARTAFQLFDSRKRFDRKPRRKGPRVVPRVINVWPDPHLSPLWQRPESYAAPAPPPDDGQVDAKRLGQRLQALKLALEDLPRQAKRLVRWRMRRQAMASPKFRDPMRPGRPPGYREKPGHEVDEVLRECHALARDAERPDTS
jgi:hypothetical protein